MSSSFDFTNEYEKSMLEFKDILNTDFDILSKNEEDSFLSNLNELSGSHNDPAVLQTDDDFSNYIISPLNDNPNNLYTHDNSDILFNENSLDYANANHNEILSAEEDELLSVIDTILSTNEPSKVVTPQKVIQKKKSFKRLPSTSSSHLNQATIMSANKTRRISRSSSNAVMAKAAAKMATTNTSIKPLDTKNKSEPAKAAARAVGISPKQLVQKNTVSTISEKPHKLISTSLPSKTIPSSYNFSNSFSVSSKCTTVKSNIPSSCSIHSSNTVNTNNSNKSSISNASDYSKNSTFSYNNNQPYNYHYASRDTLETIISLNEEIPSGLKTDSFQNNIQFPKQYGFSIQDPPIFRENFIHEMSRSRSSTASFHEQSIATPPSIAIANNYSGFTTPKSQQQPRDSRSISVSKELENVSNSSPLTPVTKTVFKFEKLSTTSPMRKESTDNTAPKLSIWKTSSSTKPAKKYQLDSNNIIINHQFYNTTHPATTSTNTGSNTNTNTTTTTTANSDKLLKLSPNTKKHSPRNSVHSVDSGTSTNSTISNTSHKDESSASGHKKSKSRSKCISSTNSTIKRGDSKDSAFKSLINTFNNKEPDNYPQPKVYSNIVQGLVEFQVKMHKSK